MLYTILGGKLWNGKYGEKFKSKHLRAVENVITHKNHQRNIFTSKYPRFFLLTYMNIQLIYIF